MILVEYRRREAFRHVLVHEVPVTYICKAEEKKTNGQGNIIDISPSGLKLFTEEKLPSDKGIVELDLSFKLHTKPIHVNGIVCWKRVYGDGYQYGIDLDLVDTHQEMIISELKLRRRKEVFEQK